MAGTCSAVFRCLFVHALQTACESLKIIVKEYENAKKLIKESV